MIEQSNGADRRKLRAVDQAETLFALARSRKWRAPVGLRAWVGNIEEKQAKFAINILLSPRQEVEEAEGVLQNKINGIRNEEVGLQVESTIREAFASAAVEILRRRGQIEAARSALQQRRELTSSLSSTSPSSGAVRRDRL